jgi:hypothetical protein
MPEILTIDGAWYLPVCEEKMQQIECQAIHNTSDRITNIVC